MGLRSDVPHNLSLSLSRENVGKTFFSSLSERIRRCVLGGAEERIQQSKTMFGRKGKELLIITIVRISVVAIVAGINPLH